MSEVEESLTDAPAIKSDVRLKSPLRNKATKRRGGTARNDKEPSAKRIAMEEHDGIDVDPLAAKNEDQLILYHAILGHDLTKTSLNARLTFAGNRHVIGQRMGVDMSEMFGPERVTAVCKQYGLVPGQAMNIKNGFDLAVDRKKAWDSILRDKPKLIIGSPPCTFSQYCRNSTNTCTVMMLHGRQYFMITSNKRKDM